MGFRKITVSFKNTKKDIALYNVVMNWDDKTYTIKELLRKEFKDAIAKELKTLEETPNFDDLTKDLFR